MILVVGMPFSGKLRFVETEVARREKEDGQLGIAIADWTRIYTAIVPGIQSSLRDDQLSATGAARLAGTIYERLVTEIATRELPGYVLSQSPRRAIAMADRINATEIVEVQATEDEIADRVADHLDALRAKVKRAAKEESQGRCLQALIAYHREKSGLVGRARGVKLKRREWVPTGPVLPFDRGLWIRGLTTAGRGALRALIDEGNPEPSPADVMKWLVKRR